MSAAASQSVWSTWITKPCERPARSKEQTSIEALPSESTNRRHWPTCTGSRNSLVQAGTGTPALTRPLDGVCGRQAAVHRIEGEQHRERLRGGNLCHGRHDAVGERLREAFTGKVARGQERRTEQLRIKWIVRLQQDGSAGDQVIDEVLRVEIRTRALRAVTHLRHDGHHGTHDPLAGPTGLGTLATTTHRTHRTMVHHGRHRFHPALTRTARPEREEIHGRPRPLSADDRDWGLTRSNLVPFGRSAPVQDGHARSEAFRQDPAETCPM